MRPFNDLYDFSSVAGEVEIGLRTCLIAANTISNCTPVKLGYIIPLNLKRRRGTDVSCTAYRFSIFGFPLNTAGRH